jgi:hypothetical protein
MRAGITLPLYLSCALVACQTTEPIASEARFVVNSRNRPEGPNETFRIVLRDTAEIARAESVLRRGPLKVVTGRLVAGDGGFNAPWRWHLKPDSTWLFDMTIELCQVTPSGVEAELAAWLEYGLVCVTPAEIVARER